MKKKRVYVLEGSWSIAGSCDSQQRMFGVYSTRQRAEARQAKEDRPGAYQGARFFISELELDE